MDENWAWETVRDYLAGHVEIDPAELRPDTHLFKDLGLDSLDALDLLAMLESRFRIPLVEKEAQAIRTLGDVVAYMLRHLPR